MTKNKYHIAQVNIGRMRGPIDSEIMAGFVGLLDEINALADRSPGFVWRLQTEAGDATTLQPYDDARIILNMSVWENVEDLKSYVYNSAHAAVMRRRKEWFEKFDGLYMTMWWVKAGHIPTMEEARERLDRLTQYGESEQAFTFKRIFPDPDQSAPAAIELPFEPCPAI
jgi:hypothetical protein